MRWGQFVLFVAAYLSSAPKLNQTCLFISIQLLFYFHFPSFYILCLVLLLLWLEMGLKFEWLIRFSGSRNTVGVGPRAFRLTILWNICILCWLKGSHFIFRWLKKMKMLLQRPRGLRCRWMEIGQSRRMQQSPVLTQRLQLPNPIYWEASILLECFMFSWNGGMVGAEFTVFLFLVLEKALNESYLFVFLFVDIYLLTVAGITFEYWVRFHSWYCKLIFPI